MGDLSVRRERPQASGTILVIEERIAEFDRNAGALTIFQYVRLLVEHGFKVIFLPHVLQAVQPYTRILQRMGVEVLYGDFDAGRWFAANGPYLDGVLVARPAIASEYVPLVRGASGARILYYTHDLHSLRERRRHEVTGDRRALHESRRLHDLESRVFRSVDVVLSPSADEVDAIREMAPGADVRTLIPYFYRPAPADTPPVPMAERHDILFVGGFRHTPNIDAALFLVERVMPEVWARVPSARAVIVGEAPPDELLDRADERVAILGYVPDLAPYFASARVSLSPLRFGAGVKGKIVAALEAGVPVVTTSVGNEGLHLVPGQEALVADEPEGLAAHVVALFQDDALAERLRRAGRRVIEERFGEARARDALFDALGFRLCHVCGWRSWGRGGERPAHLSGAPEPFTPCERCASPLDIAALAEAVVAPYRRFACPSLSEALPLLKGSRVVGWGDLGPMGGLLEAVPSFESWPASDIVTLAEEAHATTVDLLVGRDPYGEMPDPGALGAAMRRVLKPGGRHLLAVGSVGERVEVFTKSLDESGFEVVVHGWEGTGDGCPPVIEAVKTRA